MSAGLWVEILGRSRYRGALNAGAEMQRTDAGAGSGFSLFGFADAENDISCLGRRRVCSVWGAGVDVFGPEAQADDAGGEVLEAGDAGEDAEERGAG